MASAATKTGNGALPVGFKSPFVRVEQEGSHDDLLAVAATLTNKTLAEVKKMAVTLGTCSIVINLTWRNSRSRSPNTSCTRSCSTFDSESRGWGLLTTTRGMRGVSKETH